MINDYNTNSNNSTRILFSPLQESLQNAIYPFLFNEIEQVKAFGRYGHLILKTVRQLLKNTFHLL